MSFTPHSVKPLHLSWAICKWRNSIEKNSFSDSPLLSPSLTVRRWNLMMPFATPLHRWIYEQICLSIKTSISKCLSEWLCSLGSWVKEQAANPRFSIQTSFICASRQSCFSTQKQNIHASHKKFSTQDKSPRASRESLAHNLFPPRKFSAQQILSTLGA